MDQILILFTIVLLMTIIISEELIVCEDSSTSNFSPEENPYQDLFEGDIEISEDEEEIIENGEAGAGITGDHFRWPHRTIPYEISPVFNSTQKEIILKAMDEISQNTCIKFKPAEIEADYVFIRNGTTCSSSVGRRKVGMQTITLSIENKCVVHGLVMHELTHTIGFWHEQSRTDRDKFIKIQYKNIIPARIYNFEAYTSKKIHDYGVPYDYDSLMHYSDKAFISPEALKNNEKTIIPLKPGAKIGQRSYLSKLDAVKINRMYCPKDKTAGNIKKLIAVHEKKTVKEVTTTTRPNFWKYYMKQPTIPFIIKPSNVFAKLLAKL